MSWNGSNQAPNSPGKRPAAGASVRPPSRGTKHGLIAGTIVVVIGGAALWWFVGRAPSSAPSAVPTPKSAAKIAEATPQIAANEAVETVIAVTNANVRMENGVEVLRSQMSTNSNGTVVERLWLANGTTKRKIRPPKPVFENPSDQLIAMALSVKPGQPMPPLPGLANVDEDFAKSILSPVRIEETDSDETRELKAMVMEARAYLAEEVKKGGTVQEALRHYQADMEKYADSHLMAVQQIKEIREESGDDAAKEFRDRINASFRQRGIPELETSDNNLPKRRKEK